MIDLEKRRGHRRPLTRTVLTTLAIVSMALVSAGCELLELDDAPEIRASVLVTLQTEMGDMEVEVDRARAPVTAENFLRYVDAGHYDGGRFHRTVHLDNQPDNDLLIEVVQAGSNPERAGDDFPPIPLERTNRTGLMHIDGAISMARLGPDTATSDFFICIGDQPSLDYGGNRNPDGQGFAAFGRVVSGMRVVRRIQAAPASGQSLDPPITISRVRRHP